MSRKPRDRKEYNNNYRKNNLEKVREYDRKRYERDKEKRREAAKKHYHKNREDILKKARENYKPKTPEQKERKAAVAKIYRHKNIDKIRKNAAAYNRKQRATNSLFNLTDRVRSRIYESYNQKGWRKTSKVQAILGCDFRTLDIHLIGTALRNYGCYIEGEQYHIDHIIPLASAKTETDLLALNHYTNLQLLTPIDNMKKGSKQL